MKFFVDSTDVAEIAKLAATGLVDGVTTNPSLVAKAGRPLRPLVEEICALIDGPVSVEVVATDKDNMLREADKIRVWAKNICIKLPLTKDGLAACHVLSGQGVDVNVTLCFSPLQALLAAKAGARFVSPFVGRLDDIGHDGMGLIADIIAIYRQYPQFQTEVLVASVRHSTHVAEAARLGADVATLPPAVIWKLFDHPLTDKGLADFLRDWEKSGLTAP